MRKFEYQIIKRNTVEGEELFFNDIGQQGWELVSVQNAIYYIFKREITEASITGLSKLEQANFFRRNVQESVKRYEDFLNSLSDRELYDHCYNNSDGSFRNHYVALGILAKRGIQRYRRCTDCENGCTVCYGTKTVPWFEGK